MPNYHRSYRKGPGVGKWQAIRNGSSVRVRYVPAESAPVAEPVPVEVAPVEPVETVEPLEAPVAAEELVATATEEKPKTPRKPRKKKSDD